MAVILAGMPDLWQRLLAEHAPDSYGRCRECRTATGIAAAWPCAARRIAEEARALHGRQGPSSQGPSSEGLSSQGLPRQSRVPSPREAELDGRHGRRFSSAQDQGWPT